MKLLVVLLAFAPLVGAAETLTGHADKVRDGDTIVVSGVPVRLQGVAVPELKQKWGRASYVGHNASHPVSFPAAIVLLKSLLRAVGKGMALSQKS